MRQLLSRSSGSPVVKMYSFLVVKHPRADPSVVEKQRSKGMHRGAHKKRKNGHYLVQLQAPTEIMIIHRRIGSKLHLMYKWEAKKRGLCAFEDKRFLL